MNLDPIRILLFATGLSASCASASVTINDLNQLPGSAFGYYALVQTGGSTHNLALAADTSITGNVALGNPVSLHGNSGTITGNLDFAGATNGTSSVVVTGTTTANVTRASQAATDAVSLFTAYSAVTGTALTASSLNVSTTPGTAFNGNTNEHIYAIAAGYTSALTITAAADQYVILNMGKGSSGNASLFGLTLAGGITSDHVLINVETSGNLSSGSAHGLTVNADVIDDAGPSNIDNFTLNGRFFCTDAANDCGVVSGAKIVAGVDLVATPEPRLWSISAGLFLVLASQKLRARYRRRTTAIADGSNE